MILRPDQTRLYGMPGEAEGRWKDQEPQESQFCHLFRKIVRRRQILGLSYFGGLLWWKVAWQRPKEMPPANISFTGQSCLSQPEPDAHIQQRHHSEMRIFWGAKGSFEVQKDLVLHLDVFLSAQTSGTSTHSTSERRRKLCLSGQWSEVQLQVQVSSTMVALTPTTNNPSSPCLASLPAVCSTVILSKLGTLQVGNRAFCSLSAFSVRFWWIKRTKSAMLV